MALRIYPTRSAPLQPWRNGGGVTRELLAWAPDGSADWRLRVSVATISRDGPFSALAGVQRWFAVLDGAGVALHWPQRRLELRPGDDPVHFEGDAPPHCTLLGGTTQDLNLMVRGGAAAMARAVPGQQRRLRAGQAGLYAPAGGVLQDGRGGRLTLPEEALAWDDAVPDGATWSYESGAAGKGLPPALWLSFDPG